MQAVTRGAGRGRWDGDERTKGGRGAGGPEAGVTWRRTSAWVRRTASAPPRRAGLRSLPRCVGRMPRAVALPSTALKGSESIFATPATRSTPPPPLSPLLPRLLLLLLTVPEEQPSVRALLAMLSPPMLLLLTLFVRECLPVSDAGLR